MPAPLEIAVLASGTGTNLDALARAQGAYRIALVVVDRPRAGAIEVARHHALEVVDVGRPGAAPDAWAARLTAELEQRGVRLVVLAGFKSILPSSWVGRWAGRAINLHPSLLPRFGGPGMYGLKVHAAVIAAGERESGATVHLITSDVDGGPPIARARVPVEPGDTAERLRDRIHPVEADLLVRTVNRFATGALALPYSDGDEGRRTPPTDRRRD